MNRKSEIDGEVDRKFTHKADEETGEKVELAEDEETGEFKSANNESMIDQQKSDEMKSFQSTE